MGSPIDTWDGATAYFTGAGGVTPVLVLLIAIAVCVGAILYGGKHEAESYKRLELE